MIIKLTHHASLHPVMHGLILLIQTAHRKGVQETAAQKLFFHPNLTGSINCLNKRSKGKNHIYELQEYVAGEERAIMLLIFNTLNSGLQPAGISGFDNLPGLP